MTFALKSRLLQLALALTVVGVGVRPAAVYAQAKPAAAKVDLNTASESALEGLPGVGAATAKKIIAGRPYAAIGDLAKAGVPAKTITTITPLVTIGAPAAAKTTTPAVTPPPPPKTTTTSSSTPTAKPGALVDLNSASEKDLEALKGVGPATAKKIIAGRPYSTIQGLSKAGVPAATITAITPFVTIGAATPPPPPPSPSPAPKPAATTPATTGAMSAGPPPVRGMVWVNLDTKVFHREGDRYYGNTKHGKYMTEADALKAGYREAKKGGGF